MKLSKEFLEKQKAALLAEKERISNEIKNLDKYPDYGGFSEDRVQELTDYENNMSIEDQMKLLLKKVNVALKAIDDGTYGICRVCRNQIEKGRLEIMPYADICVSCKEKNGKS